MFRSVSVVGLGYIGLPTAALFASCKMNVIGVDINVETLEAINHYKIPDREPGLNAMVLSALAEGFLRTTVKPEPSDVFVIAVPTPLTDVYKPDLSAIEAAAKAIAPVLEKGNLVILESTSSVGITEKLADWLAEVRSDLTFPQQADESADIQIAYCAERVLPGNILHELVHNNRVIGGMSHKANELAMKLYKTFAKGDIAVTDTRTAEMCKLVENTYRDINIAFANEISIICDRLDINVWKLISLANSHPRVNILNPGPGVGGHCIAVDPWFLVDKTPNEARLIHMARSVNIEKSRWAVQKIFKTIDSLNMHTVDTSTINIACLGLTYKADVDDLRESPSIEIVNSLAERYRGRVAVVEPNIDDLPMELKRNSVTLMPLEQAIHWATFVVILVNHKQFKEIDFHIRSAPHVIDLVGIGMFR